MTNLTLDELKAYHESTRRKVLERQYRESVARPVKQDLKEVIERLDRIEKRLGEIYLKVGLDKIHGR